MHSNNILSQYRTYFLSKWRVILAAIISSILLANIIKYTFFKTEAGAQNNDFTNVFYVAFATLERSDAAQEIYIRQGLMYTPSLFLWLGPFLLMPKVIAGLVYIIFGIFFYVWGYWRIFPEKQKITLPIVCILLYLASQPALITFQLQQNSLTLSACIIWGVLLLRRHPYTAGGVWSITFFKPHIALALLCFLLLRRQMRATTAFIMSLLAQVIIVSVLWDSNLWWQFVTHAVYRAKNFLELTEWYHIDPLIMSGLLFKFNLSSTTVWSFSTLWFIVIAGLAAYIGTRTRNEFRAAAVLCGGLALSSPYFLYYDELITAWIPLLLYKAYRDDGYGLKACLLSALAMLCIGYKFPFSDGIIPISYYIFLFAAKCVACGAAYHAATNTRVIHTARISDSSIDSNQRIV